MTSTMNTEIVSVSIAEDRVDSDHVWVADLTYSCRVEEWDGEKLVKRAAVLHGSREECEAIKVNASAETLAAVAAYCRIQAADAYARHELARQMSLAQIIGKGTRVRIVRGRSERGAEGIVFWAQDEGYQKLGLKTDDGTTIWSYQRNVEIVSDNFDFPTLAELRAAYLAR